MHALAANVIILWEHHGSMDMDDPGDAQGGRGAEQEAGAPFQPERHFFICIQAAAAGLQSCMSNAFEAMESFIRCCLRMPTRICMLVLKKRKLDLKIKRMAELQLQT